MRYEVVGALVSALLTAAVAGFYLVATLLLAMTVAIVLLESHFGSGTPAAAAAAASVVVGGGGAAAASKYAADSADDLAQHIARRVAQVNQRLKQRNGPFSCRLDDLKVGRHLGQGSFGEVHLVTSPSGQTHVLKTVRMHEHKTRNDLDTTLDEVANHARLTHPHIVRLWSVFVGEGGEGGEGGSLGSVRSLKIVLEFAAGGTLHDQVQAARRHALDSRRGARLPTRLIEVWLGQIASAILHMHRKQVLHRDLSSPNILLRGDGDVIIGDLGVSKRTGASTFTMAYGAKDATADYKPKTTIGTPQYMSPEMMSGKEYSVGSDVWALGVLLFEMLALERPFDGANLLNTAILVAEGTPTASAAGSLARCGHPSDLCDLAGAGEGCLLQISPERRASLDELVLRFPPPHGRRLARPPQKLRGAAQPGFDEIGDGGEGRLVQRHQRFLLREPRRKVLRRAILRLDARRESPRRESRSRRPQPQPQLRLGHRS